MERSIEQGSKAQPSGSSGSLSSNLEQMLELGEDPLNRIEVGTVGRLPQDTLQGFEPATINGDLGYITGRTGEFALPVKSAS